MMFHQMMNDKLFCGLDIGSQRIKTGVLRLNDERKCELIGVYETQTHGFLNASVSDLTELSDCIHMTLNDLSQKLGLKFKAVQLGLGGESIDVREQNTVIPLMDRSSKVITQRDIKNVTTQARLLGINMEEEILHDLPQYYTVDDTNFAQNPEGLYGRKLGVNSMMILADINRIRNLTKAVNQAGYDVHHFYFSTYSSAEVCLTTDDKDQGSALIDIGSKSTSILVFKNKVLQSVKKIDMGGDHLTEGIVNELNVTFDLAEDIKKSYGTALFTQEYKHEEILVKKDSNYISIERGQIYKAMEPYIDKLLNQIIKNLTSAKCHLLSNGIVMVGGGSLLPGLLERIAQSTDYPVRLGHIHIDMKQKLQNTASFSSVVGLAYCGFNENFYTGTSDKSVPWTKRLSTTIRDLYQDYF